MTMPAEGSAFASISAPFIRRPVATTLLMIGLMLAGITGYCGLPVAALPQVGDYADSVLAQKISQVSGVGLVTTGGGQKPAVRVQVDPVALAGTGLTLEEVRAAIATANVNQPKGSIDGPRQEWALATNDQ